LDSAEDPDAEEKEKAKKEYLDKLEEWYTMDEEFGPMHYKPYPGGSIYQKEVLTVKPGAKVWVDGGYLDYPDETCIAKKLDCSETCCMQRYCAPHMGLCLNYRRHPYSEIYIGFLVVMMIMLGVPTCIGIIEFVLNFKFCRRYDEEVDAMLGGMTICECFTYIFTCGKSIDVPTQDVDEFVYRYQVS
jgi:hypothetical protein